MTRAARVALATLVVGLVSSITFTARAQSGRIQVSGAPGSYQIIAVPIPEQLPRVGEGTVEIVSLAGFAILGVHKWALALLAGKTRIIATIGIPANARAGLIAAVEVRFAAAGAPVITVPVEVDVSLVRALTMRMLVTAPRARSGRQVTFAYELVNGGNATETVETAVAVPVGWRAIQRNGATASVNGGETVARQVTLSIPSDAGTGAFFLKVDMLENGVVRGSIPVTVQTLEGLSVQAMGGPVVMVAVAGATDASGRASTLTTATIRGPLYDSVLVDARFSVGQSGAGPSSQALARMGSYRAIPSLVLSSPSGRLAFGAASSSFSDLTGLYAYGRGAALELHRADWRFIGLGATSNQGPYAGRSQPLFGARGDIDVGSVVLTSSLSHLRGGELSRQQLDAVGFGAILDAGFATTIAGEAAVRRFAGGTAPGWSTEIVRSDATSLVRVRATHAPGGSQAFARGTDDVAVDVSQSISRYASVSGSAWRTSDSSRSFTALRSSGWAVRPEFRVHSSTSIALNAQSSNIRVESAADQFGAASGYGSAEHQVGATISSNVRNLFASGSVAGGTISRSLGSGPTASEFSSPKIWWSTMASWRSAKTIVDFQGRMEEERDVTGAVRRPNTVSLRGLQSFGATAATGASANGEVEQIRGFTPKPATIVRAGITVPVTEIVGVKMYAERNPLFTSSPDGSPWVYAMRVEHSSRVPMIREPASTGYVYRDLNHNRKRDPGEPGFEGVTVTRGDESAVTDARGEYRLSADSRAPVVLDESTLPQGWVRQTSISPDIAVVSILTAEVRFVVTLGSNPEAVTPDIGGAHAIARDTSGREWIGRMTSATIASFDALPQGTYTLELDLTALTEPLIVRAPLPLLYVTPLLANFVTVYLDPRPLRIFRAGAPVVKQP